MDEIEGTSLLPENIIVRIKKRWSTASEARLTMELVQDRPGVYKSWRKENFMSLKIQNVDNHDEITIKYKRRNCGFAWTEDILIFKGTLKGNKGRVCFNTTLHKLQSLISINLNMFHADFSGEVYRCKNASS
jgi:hypothetical protein